MITKDKVSNNELVIVDKKGMNLSDYLLGAGYMMVEKCESV